MKLFPTLVVDDFLDDPDYVLDLAKNAEYNDPGLTNHPGVSSKKHINDIDKELFEYVHLKLLGIYWDLKNPVAYNTRMDFLKIDYNYEGILNVGPIHVDSEHGDICAGLVYLNKNSMKDTGTSFYKKLDNNYVNSEEHYLEPMRRHHAGEHVEGIEKIKQDHFDKFEETMRVQSQYNRLLTYGSDVYHASTTFGTGQTRYIMRFFIISIDSKHQPPPMVR